MTKPHAATDILIRAIETDDYQDITVLRISGNVPANTLNLPYLSPDTIRDRLENQPTTMYGLVAVVGERVVGYLGMLVDSGRQAHVARLGMMVHADYQGRGVGTALLEAAINLAENWLNITRIALEVYTDNEPAIALYKKFGFEIEGTLRDYAYRDGDYVDSYLMARIRKDA
jgi:putative acetyltransferase